MSTWTREDRTAVGRITELIEELLDAHCDTVCLCDEQASEPEWAAHRDYLQGLQRTGQRLLAELQD
jgi:hypothetical protein